MLSYARGPEKPILEKTIAQVFLETAAKFPDGDALVVRHQNVRLTWRDLAARVEADFNPGIGPASGAPTASNGFCCNWRRRAWGSCSST
jgi:hypothetical protein